MIGVYQICMYGTSPLMITVVSKLAVETMMLFRCVYRPNAYTPCLGNDMPFVFWLKVAKLPSTEVVEFTFY